MFLISIIRNELNISKFQITKLTEEKKQLSEKLNESSNADHNLIKSRIICLNSELQHVHSLKCEIEKDLNNLGYNTSLLRTKESSDINKNHNDLYETPISFEPYMKQKSKKSVRQTQKVNKSDVHTHSYHRTNDKNNGIFKNSDQERFKHNLTVNKSTSLSPLLQSDDSETRMRSAAALKASIEDSKTIMAIVQAKHRAHQNSLLMEEKGLCIQAEQNLKNEKLELALHRRLANIEAHQTAFKESQNRKYREIIAKLLREEFLQKEKVKRLTLTPRENENYKCPQYLENNEQPSKLEQHMIDEFVKHQRKDEAVINSLENNFSVETEQNDENDAEYEKYLSQSYDSVSGLLDSFSKQQNVVTEDNVNQAICSFVSRDTMKSSSTKSNILTISTDRVLQKLTNRSSTKLSDTDNAIYDKEKEHTNCNTYHTERCSKAEKEILQRVLQQTRENIVQPQIVAGKKFDGPSFIAKPAEIWFQNIEVDKTQKIKVTLTNASYAISTCRYVGITSTLMDFVDVKFIPPGMLSPGMNCWLQIKFTPKLNKNLTGELEFLSPTGPFFIPFKATVKKCEFSIDCSVVNFGEVVIGETVFRSVKLCNSGAKGARFTFKSLSESYKEKDSDNIKESSQETINAGKCIDESIKSDEPKIDEKAESRLLAQVKLLPKLSLPDDLADFCDPDNSHSHAESENESCLSKLSYDSLTGVLQVPVTVHVVGQANKLQLIVDAVITTTDLVLSPNPINFGFAEIHETVVTRLLITNNSLLPQNFGIVELPEVMEEHQNNNQDKNEKHHSTFNKFSSNFITGELKSGYLESFNSVNLKIIWNPNNISININESIMEEEKFIIHFDDPDSSDIYIHAIGYPKNIPVWLSTSNLSMGICWFNRLYQECFAVHNRTKSALKIIFEVDKEISNHLKILPKTGFVQAESRLLAQVKLLPKLSLPDDLADFCDPDNSHSHAESENESCLSKLSYDSLTGVLQVPVTVHVVGQANKLQLIVDAVITTTDLVLSPNPINFGFAEIHETVVTRLLITNNSLLPQNFGIVELPEFVDIQPNDGFGVILGKETIELEVLFQPKKAKEYHFVLVCKSGIGRIFTTECTGVGVYSPLSLSTNQLYFNPTPISESNTSNLKIHNHHTSANPFTHVQPCIGTDTKPVPVGPRAFELQVIKATITNSYGLIAEDNLSNDLLESILSNLISFYPATGTLKPGEANQPVSKAGQITPAKKDKIADKKTLKIPDEKTTSETDTFILPTDPDSINEGSVEYNQGFNSLLTYYPYYPPTFFSNRNESEEVEFSQPLTEANELSVIKLGEYTWPGVHVVYRVACFVGDGPGSDTAAKPSPTYKKENTLFFELICPIIRPALLIESNKNYNQLDFGAICAGQRNIRILTVKNISPYSLKLKPKPLNPVGAFEIIQFKESIKSREICSLSFAFTPNPKQTYCTEIFTLDAYPIDNKVTRINVNEFCPIHVKFSGICVTPIVELIDPPELASIPYSLQKTEQQSLTSNLKQTTHYLNFGYILLGGFIERQITLYNPTNITLNFQIQIDENQTGGSRNLNGLPVFMVLPNQGKTKPGDKQVVSITFSPDHDSEAYQQTYLITLHSQIYNSHKLILTGACKQHNLYIRGGDRLDNTNDILFTNVQNDFLGAQFLTETKESKTTSYLIITGQQSSLVREDSNTNSEIEPVEKEDTDNLPTKKEVKHKETPARRILYAGYVHSSSSGTKKSGECTIENLNELSSLGFTVSPTKNIVMIINIRNPYGL
ncbi:uncharacterized protein DC041_0004264 [Schistosoma bovis]|uniref:Uncharacterized protein n=1 Tax=Schistosoma bovis TaxID=6184 RepID=A0A430QHY8_SCHBO|nr:uncharacterized protein DC041_0004264 [Schistosoma bovis]